MGARETQGEQKASHSREFTRFARAAAMGAAPRRRLFQGKYRPKNYLMIGTRRSMLQWLSAGAA
jgi:hypothetical protein